MSSNRSFTHLFLVSMLTASSAWAGPSKDVSSSAQQREIARPKPGKAPQQAVVAREKPKQDPGRTKHDDVVQAIKKPAVGKVDDKKEARAIQKPRDTETTKRDPASKKESATVAKPKTETAQRVEPVKVKREKARSEARKK